MKDWPYALGAQGSSTRWICNGRLVVAVTLQAADEGDTTTIEETLVEALLEQLEAAAEEAAGAVDELSEVVADIGLSFEPSADGFCELDVRSYVSEPQRWAIAMGRPNADFVDSNQAALIKGSAAASV